MDWPNSPSASATVLLQSSLNKQHRDELSDKENSLVLTKSLRVCIVVHGLNCALLILNQTENSTNQNTSSPISWCSSSNGSNMEVDTVETKDSDTKDEEDRLAAESSNENDEGAQRYRKTLKNKGVQVKASLTCCCHPLFTEKLH